MVKWESVKRSRGHEGLGVKLFRLQNKSLLMKSIRKYNQEEQVLWREVIPHKYGQIE